MDVAIPDRDQFYRWVLTIQEMERRRRSIGSPTGIVAHQRRYPYIEGLFKNQKAFVLDPSKNKAAKTSRRAGKTWGMASYLLYEAERWDGCEVCYITLTRQMAKELLWAKLKWLNHIYKLGVTFNNSDLIATTRNGSQVYLRGAHDRDDIEKLRGHAFKLVVIDESQSFGAHIEELIDDVIDATLLDGDGTLAMTGTPNAACVGRFHDATNGVLQGWKVHEWTLFDNPHLPHAKKWLESRMQQRGWTWDHPVVQREYLGRWVRSLDQMVYRFNWDRNRLGKTTGPERTKLLDSLYLILSIDLGYHDATAMTVGGFNETDPNYYVLDGFKKVGMLPHDVALKIREFRNRYEFIRIVADTGGLGKMLVEEFRTRYALPVEPAEKVAKNDFIELCNSDLDTGRVKIDDEVPVLKELCSQLAVLQWDEKRKKEDPRYANDLADSFLYGWREGKQFASESPRAPFPEDSTEYMDELEQREAERLVRSSDEDFTEKYDDDLDPFGS